MLVRLVADFPFKPYELEAGAEIDLPAEDAARLIKSGVAEAIEVAPKKAKK